MSMPRRAALLVMLACAPGWAAAQSFLAPQQADFSRLLAPPPADGSPQQVADMAELVGIDQTRTPERLARGRVDASESVFVMYGAVLGPKFGAAALPLAAKLFDRLGDTEEALNQYAKARFARLRPFMANPDLHPVPPLSRSGSYPSGHATRSALIGVVLAAMVPEQRGAIFTRMQDYAESRLVLGMHYRGDIVAGRIAGTAAAAVLFADPGFTTAYGPARDEVRAALGLVP